MLRERQIQIGLTTLAVILLGVVVFLVVAVFYRPGTSPPSIQLAPNANTNAVAQASPLLHSPKSAVPLTPRRSTPNRPFPVNTPTSIFSSGDLAPIKPIGVPPPTQKPLPIEVISGFACSPRQKVTTKPPSANEDAYFVIPLAATAKAFPQAHWFLFRIDHAAGKNVQIDLQHVPGKWRTLNPVYADVSNLHDLANFASKPSAPPTASATPIHAANRQTLPDDSGEVWRFVRNIHYDAPHHTLILHLH